MTQDSTANVNHSQFIDLGEAALLTQRARSTIIKHSKLGNFPPMVRYIGNRIYFLRADVQNFIDERVASAKGVA